MTITPIATAATAPAPSPTTGATAKITSDFTMFLKMLTVQMQNQDPLNPIESTDYAVQLATFSGVEQQVRTNQLLAEMQTRFSQMGLADMAGWIGKEARSDAPVQFNGSAVDLSLSPAAGASTAVLVVRDAQGALVAREEIAAPGPSYTWLGADATGMPLQAGAYSLSLESMAGDRLLATTPVEHYARVVEARSTAAGTLLVLDNGAEVAAARVRGLRDPQG
jgi:flagellar basal-body rod modification protein FlgD